MKTTFASLGSCDIVFSDLCGHAGSAFPYSTSPCCDCNSHHQSFNFLEEIAAKELTALFRLIPWRTQPSHSGTALSSVHGES